MFILLSLDKQYHWTIVDLYLKREGIKKLLITTMPYHEPRFFDIIIDALFFSPPLFIVISKTTSKNDAPSAADQRGRLGGCLGAMNFLEKQGEGEEIRCEASINRLYLR